MGTDIFSDMVSGTYCRVVVADSVSGDSDVRVEARVEHAGEPVWLDMDNGFLFSETMKSLARRIEKQRLCKGCGKEIDYHG